MRHIYGRCSSRLGATCILFHENDIMFNSESSMTAWLERETSTSVVDIMRMLHNSVSAHTNWYGESYIGLF